MSGRVGLRSLETLRVFGKGKGRGKTETHASTPARWKCKGLIMVYKRFTFQIQVGLCSSPDYTESNSLMIRSTFTVGIAKRFMSGIIEKKTYLKSVFH